MTLAWMLYALVIGALIGLAALLLERAARFLRLPGRHVWLLAIALSAIWPFAVLLLQLQPGGGSPGGASIIPFAAAIESVSRATVLHASPASVAQLDTLVFVLWAAASAVFLGRLASDSYRIRRLKEGWTITNVDGLLVRVAPECGPAVVGATRMEIVIPEWTLSFDEALRRLILRHEDEHRIARDPLVLQIARIFVALLPWHLALHWQLRRLKLAVEVDCDARVLHAHPDADRYAKLLLAIAQLRSAPRGTPALALMENTSQLEVRILALQRTFARRRAVPALSAVTAALLAVATACDVREPARPQSAGKELSVQQADKGNQPYFSYEVSKLARPLSTPAPAYPSTLRQNRQEGKVIIQFVVDTTGRADMATFKVIKSSNELFTFEVKKVLPAYRFHPAEIQGRKVPMFVQLPFEFMLSEKRR